MIDGKDHPELIPDLTAYRLFLMALSQHIGATEIEKQRLAAYVSMIHISDQDSQALLTVLVSFHDRYMKLVQDFNKEATARGTSFDPAPILHERDLLVQATHDSLKSVLSADGWSGLDNHIQGEKANMKIPASEGVK
jgi:hypothetical protein